VLELAEVENAVIVSNDQYRDLMTEKAIWKTMVEERLDICIFLYDFFIMIMISYDDYIINTTCY